MVDCVVGKVNDITKTWLAGRLTYIAEWLSDWLYRRMAGLLYSRLEENRRPGPGYWSF